VTARTGLLIPSIAALCVFAVLVSLGTWQVERKAWKENLIATIDARFAAPPTRLPPGNEWPRLDAAHDEFRRVAATAEFLNDKEALVYTSGSSFRADVSGPGYWVFTPARVAGGLVLVNRGFVPEGRQDPASRRDGQIAGPAEIVGVMRWPEKPGLFTPNNDAARNIWFARDTTAIADAKGLGPVAPFYIEQEAPAAPGGWPKVGKLQPSLPNNHLGYAVTWYGLALVLAVSFGIWMIGRRRSGRSRSFGG
jgi:surfeit locus 1 family protein